ncbi:MAG: mevalonate kinase [Anaerolineae bacterium]
MRDHVGRGAAPAKAILLGEHAVVYGWPAIAVPLPQLRAKAEARFDARFEGVAVEAAARFGGVSVQREPDQPLAKAALLALEAVSGNPSHVVVHVESTIPIAAGLGSGAAVSAAIMRAIADLFGSPLPEARLSALVYEIEKIHHGTPSGIDNTVVVYGLPVYFRKGAEPEFLQPAAPLTLLVADTGVASATREAVAAVRQARERDPQAVEACMARIGGLAEQGRAALEGGDLPRLGRLMDEDHGALVELGVSSPELDALVAAAREAGALGAKLTGAGRGGHAIALADAEAAAPVAAALTAAGARRVTTCRIAAGQRTAAAPRADHSPGRL